jgi:hypothetical protein
MMQMPWHADTRNDWTAMNPGRIQDVDIVLTALVR